MSAYGHVRIACASCGRRLTFPAWQDSPTHHRCPDCKNQVTVIPAREKVIQILPNGERVISPFHRING